MLLDIAGGDADGAALRRSIRPESRRNGAAMRCVPLGLIPDKLDLWQVEDL
jgi:hypothetical protein